MEGQVGLEVGDRMKRYESVFTSVTIDPSKPFVMRMDGHAFSKFTKPLKTNGKVYDWNLHVAFYETTKRLMKEFGAVTGYTHSDEISLLFYPTLAKDGESWKQIIYNGRVQKLQSYGASCCSTFFNQELKNQFEKVHEYDEKTLEHMMSGQACFDCRVFQLPNDQEMFSYLFWRSKKDCFKNHVSELARAHFSHKQLHGKSSTQKIEMLKEAGVNWDEQPHNFKHGTFIKKVKTNNNRTKFHPIEIDLVKFEDNINTFLKTDKIDIN